MSELTLFPEHIYFENGRSEVQAMQIASRLRSIGLSVLEGSAAYAGVARRLKREGIGNLMQLVALTNAQTKEWHGAVCRDRQSPAKGGDGTPRALYRHVGTAGKASGASRRFGKAQR